MWTASDLNAENGLDAQAGTLGASAEVRGSSLIYQRFRFDRLNQPWLPAAFDPVELGIEGQSVRFDPSSSALVAVDGTGPGFTYDVTSRVVSPPPDVLDAIPPQSTATTARYTALPPDTPSEIYAIARELTKQYPTMYRKVLAIQAHLRTFRYNERVAPGHGVNDVLHFLTRSREGYCEQFAGSMAVLLRALGIPARVVVGFTPGTFDSRSGGYRVTTRNLHSWVEALFPRVGWLPFEPTPSRSNPAAAHTAVSPRFERDQQSPQQQPECVSARTGLGGLRGEPGATACAANPAGSNAPTPDGTANNQVRDPNARAGVPSGQNPRLERPERDSNLPIGWLLGLVVAALAAIPIAKILWRRRALRRARSNPRELVLAAYSVLAATAADLGLGRKENETIQEYSMRLKATTLFSDGHLDKLTRLVGVAAYGTDPISTLSAEEAVRLSRVITKEIARSRDPSGRVLGWFRPGRGFLRA